MTTRAEAGKHKELEAEVWQMFRATLSFDPQQDNAPTGEDPAAVTFNFMRENIEAWVYPRPELDSIRSSIAQGNRVVLYGETGCGKTTICNALRSQNISSGGPELITIFDFNSLAHVLRNLDKAAAAERIGDEVLRWITESIADSEFADTIYDRYRQMVPELAPEFEPFREAYRQASGAWFSRDDAHSRQVRIAELPKLVPILDDCWKEYYHCSAQEKTRYWMRSLCDEVLPVLCFDNIDPIGREARDAIGMVAQELALASQNRAGIVVACRTEHRSLMQTALDTGTAEPILVTALPSAEHEAGESAFERIIDNRLKVLSSRFRLTEEVRFSLGASSHEFDDALESIVDRFERVRSALSAVHEPTRQADRLISSLLHWTNGDIRSALLELVALVDTERDISALRGPNRKLLEDRAVHMFYRHLCTGERASAGTSLRTCLQFFTPQDSESTGDHRPFYFLRLRLLSHFRYRQADSMITAASVVHEFGRSFGVPESPILDALQWLAYREGMNSGYIRLENSNGRIVSLDGEQDLADVSIKMLPAGTYFISWLTKTVEFLYWNDLDAHPDRQRAGGDNSQIDLRDTGASATVKVAAASEFLKDVLLPLFLREHPYMDKEVTASPRDSSRLAKFRNAFGFQNNQWFIQQLNNSIEAYAKAAFPPVERGVYSECSGLVLAYVDRLNFVEKLPRAVRQSNV